MYAAGSGHLQVVEFLLEQPGIYDCLGCVPLMYATGSGHLQVVEFLLEQPGIYNCLVCVQLMQDGFGYCDQFHAAVVRYRGSSEAESYGLWIEESYLSIEPEHAYDLLIFKNNS